MADVPLELQQLLALSRDRATYQNPLFQATTQLAYSLLPTYARQGTSLGTLGSGLPQVSPQSGGVGLGRALGAGALGALASGGSGAGGPLKALIDGLKKLFSHQYQIQGDKPYGGGALTGGGQDPFQPFTGWDPYGGDPNLGRSPETWDPQLQPNVTTSEVFGGLADPYLNTGGGGSGESYDWSLLPGYGGRP